VLRIRAFIPDRGAEFFYLVLRIRAFIPDRGAEFFYLGQKDSGSASKNFSIFNPKTVSKLSEK
jgi:hypothetical protein